MSQVKTEIAVEDQWRMNGGSRGGSSTLKCATLLVKRNVVEDVEDLLRIFSTRPRPPVHGFDAAIILHILHRGQKPQSVRRFRRGGQVEDVLHRSSTDLTPRARARAIIDNTEANS